MSEYPTHPESERSIHPVSIIRDIDHPAIRSTEKAVLWALASQLNLPKGRDTVYSSMATIAKNAGLEESGARRVMNWLVQVGIVLEVEGPYRAKSRQIDLARLVSLPTDLRRSRVDVVPPALDSVQGTPDVVTPSGVVAPLDHVHPPLDSVPLTLDSVHPVQDVVQPKNDSKNKTRTIRRTISATVPARGSAPIGAPLVLDFGQTDPSAPATIPAQPAARPEPSKTSVESLPVDASNPPPNGKGKAGKRPAGKLTESQAKAHTAAIDCWHKTFIEYKNEKPIITGKDIKDIDTLLGVMQWDIDKTCALIKSAFTHVWFREKNCSIAELVKKPSTYQVPVQSERRSFGQVEPGEDFWANRDNDLAEDYGS